MGTGAVTISGGTISVTSGNALGMNNASAVLTLDGSPTITGRIALSAAGQLTVASGFNPQQKTYTLYFATSYYVAGNIAVAGGADYLSNFTLSNPRWLLEANGANLVFVSAPLNYVITGSGTAFTATLDGTTIGTANQPIQTVIDAIRTNASGSACTIQFGDGNTALDIGGGNADFSGTWGAVTLTGKITGSAVGATKGTISIDGAVSVTSRADIANTAANGNAVYYNSTSPLTISSGTVSATSTGYAIYNNSTGTVTIEPAAVIDGRMYPVLNVATPVAAPPAGTYTSAQTVTLTTTTEGAAIYYTLDGSTPSVSSTLYTGPINIPVMTTLKAIAVKEGMNNSAVLTAVYTASFTSAPVLTLIPNNQIIIYTWTASDPAADSYDLYWAEGSGLTAAQVKAGTKITGAYSGGVIKALTNGTAYSVIVTANKQGYAAIDSAVQTATPAAPVPYIITGSGTAFTATKSGSTIGTAGQSISNVLSSIRTDANGAPCTIQFGSGGEDTLDIGSSVSASFSNGTPNWGLITLTGRITGARYNTAITGPFGTIDLGGNVSMVIMTDSILNTNTTNNESCAILCRTTGTLTIVSGDVGAYGSRGYGIYSETTGRITVAGGEVGNNGASNAAVHLTGGTSTDVRLVVESGGNLTNSNSAQTARVIYNNSTGAVIIKGGTVYNTTGNNVRVVVNNSTGAIIHIGGSVTTSGSTTNLFSNNDANGIIVRWTGTAPQTYAADATTNLTRLPTAGTTAKWVNRGGVAGIEYTNANGTNTGFVPVAGVTVTP
jgi:hypothetical protein